MVEEFWLDWSGPLNLSTARGHSTEGAFLNAD